MFSRSFASASPTTSNTSERLRWQDFFVIEGSGLRTTLAALAPLVAGQLSGYAGIGMLVAVGALQVAFADFAGAKARTLLWATLSSASLALLGASVSQSSPIVTVGLMFLTAFSLTMLGAFGPVIGNLAFVLTVTYAFAQSTPVHWDRGVEYFWTFTLGGIWASLLTLLLWWLRRSVGDLTVSWPPASGYSSNSGSSVAGEPFSNWRSVMAQNKTLSAPVFQHAVRTATATALAAAICQYAKPPHGYWIVLTTLVILKPDLPSTKGRFVQRLMGTIAGGMLAMIPATYIHNVAALDALLFVFGVLAFSHLPRNYGFYVLFLTPFVVLITTIAMPSDALATQARILETILGGVLAFTIAFLLRRPSHYFQGSG